MKMVSQLARVDMNGRMAVIMRENSKEDIETDKVFYTKLMALFTKVTIFILK